jgi:molybdopterin converting factor subunit 1
MLNADKQKEYEEYDQQIIVEVKLFGSCREMIGKDKITLKLKNQMTIGDLRKKLLQLYPVLSRKIQFVVALNYEIVGEITPINKGDEVAILPPVNGG